MMECIEIDGSFGEGGGQIVRTAITLSSILNQSIIIKNIRKGRKKPGLKPQHFMALKILKKICDAKIENLKVGSTILEFSPNKVKSVELSEDVGTAGSIPLIFQVLIPLVAISKKKLKLSIKGGTDVLWSPTIDYTRFILKEVYSRMGINFSIDVIKRGYYPRGGGLVELEVFPTDKISPIILKERKIKKVDLKCSFSKIEPEIINKEIDKIGKKLTKNNFIVEKQIKKEIALDSGASIMISCVNTDSIMGYDSQFNKKTNQFDLDLDGFIQNHNTVDENLSDMIVLPASLANGMTIFQVDSITKHLETNLFVASKITGCKYGIGRIQNGFEVRIEGISYSGIK